MDTRTTSKKLTKKEAEELRLFDLYIDSVPLPGNGFRTGDFFIEIPKHEIRFAYYAMGVPVVPGWDAQRQAYKFLKERVLQDIKKCPCELYELGKYF